MHDMRPQRDTGRPAGSSRPAPPEGIWRTAPEGIRRTAPEGIRRTAPEGNRRTLLRRMVLSGLALILSFVAMAPARAADDIVWGGTLQAGDARWSQNSQIVLLMQDDGNLVLYGPSGAVWATGTQGAGNAATMQEDGNLVVYSHYGIPLWDSHTWGNPGAFLKVQDDGKLVIYRADLSVAWQSWQDCGTVVGPVGPESTVEARNGVMVHGCLVDRVRAMQDAAAADGITLAGGGYRSTAEQIALRRAHCGTSDYAIYQMPSSQCHPPTARPGQSQHERGLAIDVTANGSIISSRNSAGFGWLAAHASDYGLYNLPSEPWHWSTTGR
jgi:D-alanyl-D-alanine carboxypeptidase